MGKEAQSPRVLVIRGGAIGDFILTLPAIRLLRESIPGAHLEVLGYEPITELAVAAGLAEATRNLEHASMAKLFVPKAVLDDELQQWLSSFNLVVSYLFDPDGILRANMERMGVKTFLDCPHRVVPGQGHAAEQLARPLEKLAMFLDDPAPVIALNGGMTVSEDKPVLAIHPGSGSLRKNWPVEHWIAAAKQITAEFPQLRLALITGEAEQERGITTQVLEGWHDLDFQHWDHLPLTELASRLSQASGFIGHDSGISHLAAACGVPCMLFFGPTDPATWAPRNAGVQLVTEPSGDLRLLTFESTWARVRKFLAEGNEGLQSRRRPK
jgi:ADP-heptose:LPS heptosyltransferase